MLKNKQNISLSMPRSRSPAKTNLNSPARRNPYLDRPSPPTHRTVLDESNVTRKLDFKAGLAKAKIDGKQAPRVVNGTSSRKPPPLEESDLEMEEDDEGDLSIDDMVEASMDMVSFLQSDPAGPGSRAGNQYEEEEEEEEEEVEQIVEAPPSSQKKGRGRPSKPTAVKESSKALVKAPARAQVKASAKASVKKPSRPEPVPVVPEEEEEEEESAEEQEEESEEEVVEEVPSARKRGRPSKKDEKQPEVPVSTAKGPKKRKSLRASDGGDDNEVLEAEVEEEPRMAKKQRTVGPTASKKGVAKTSSTIQAKATTATIAPTAEVHLKPRPKSRPGRKPKGTSTIVATDTENAAGEESFVALQRGPPMPKSRGLVSVRGEASAMKQTRSGRHSYKPVDYWRGEQVVLEEEEQNDIFRGGNFVMPTIKEVVRVPQESPPAKQGARGKSRGKPKPKSKYRQNIPEGEDPEEWELAPGTVEGEIVLWEPEHEEHPPADDEPVQVTDERIAISAEAVQTSDIRDATFRFAKTLSMPFMGAGVVDLPPGGEKRPKNSRKMHMVFFVHYGKVMVTINETQFRISAGGMWFVPRGKS